MRRSQSLSSRASVYTVASKSNRWSTHRVTAYESVSVTGTPVMNVEEDVSDTRRLQLLCHP